MKLVMKLVVPMLARRNQLPTMPVYRKMTALSI
jgi:hypothetical protein